MVDGVELRPVQGRPPAQRTKNLRRKRRWKAEIWKAVPADAKPLEGPLRMRIDCYLRGKPPRNKLPDVDNMIKPILDALKGFLYADDNTIEEVCARRIDRDEHEPDRDGASDKLRGALGQWDEFVLIRVTPAR